MATSVTPRQVQMSLPRDAAATDSCTADKMRRSAEERQLEILEAEISH
jgi:hypothetical protein